MAPTQQEVPAAANHNLDVLVNLRLNRSTVLTHPTLGGEVIIDTERASGEIRLRILAPPGTQLAQRPGNQTPKELTATRVVS